MIYKPISAYPIKTNYLSPNDDQVKFKLSGIYGNKILDSYVRLGITGNNDYYADYNGFTYYAQGDPVISYNDDSYQIEFFVENKADSIGVSSSGARGKRIPSNIPLGWNIRLYEKDSLKDDEWIKSTQDTTYTDSYGYEHTYDESYPFTYQNATYRSCYFNYEKAYCYADSGAKDGGTLKEITDKKYYISTSYIPTNLIGYGSISEVSTVYLGSGQEPSSNNSSSKKSISYNSSWKNSSGKWYNNRGTNYKLIKIFPHDFHNSQMASSDSSTEYISNYDSYFAKYYIKIKGVYYKILDWRYYDWAEEGYRIKDERFTSLYTDGYGNALAMYVLIRTEDNFVCNKNTEYSIYCNYIDSDTYSLEINDPPTLTFKDSKFANQEIQFYDSEDEALNEQNAFSMVYSNLNIVGDYQQANGVYISKYDVKLYLLEDGNKTVINEVFNRCTQSIYYNFDEFKNNEKYLLHFRMTDNKGIVHNKYLCIAPKYGVESNLIKVNLTPANNANKMRIDFSHLFSIYPDEISEGSYSFVNDETGNKYLNLNNDNSLTYKDVNDTTPFDISNFFMNFTIRLHHDFNGEIISASDNDNNSYVLLWDGVKFVYKVIMNGGNIIISEYYPYEYEVSDEPNILNNQWLSTMMQNMKTSTINTNVPYIWNNAFSAQTWDSALYIHDEEASKVYWWSIVLNGCECYFYNLDKENGKWASAQREEA